MQSFHFGKVFSQLILLKQVLIQNKCWVIKYLAKLLMIFPRQFIINVMSNFSSLSKELTSLKDDQKSCGNLFHHFQKHSIRLFEISTIWKRCCIHFVTTKLLSWYQDKIQMWILIIPQVMFLKPNLLLKLSKMLVYLGIKFMNRNHLVVLKRNEKKEKLKI